MSNLATTTNNRNVTKKVSPLEARKSECSRLKEKYPNRLPVICDKAQNSDLPTIEKRRFLIPHNLLVGEFKFILLKHIKSAANKNFSDEKVIYLFVNNTSPRAGSLIQEVYDNHAQPDGFLYLLYSGENTLG